MSAAAKALVGNPFVTAVACAVVILTGIYSYFRMPVDLFPNLDIPIVKVVTHLAAASPEDVELLVSRPIEDAFRGAPGVQRVSSVSSQGISAVTIAFDWGTTIADARQVTIGRLASVQNTLPRGAAPFVEDIGTSLQEVVGYTVSGNGNLVRLGNTVRLDLVNRLLSVPGVSNVDVLGGDKRAYIVTVKQEMLRQLHIGIQNIVDTLQQNNLTAQGGYMTQGGESTSFEATAGFRLRTIS